MRRLLPVVLLVAPLALGGCGLRAVVAGWLEPPEGPVPDLSQGVQVVDHRAILEFQTRAQAFYDRLSLRRFNTHATYADSVLRDHFRSEQAFFDYYAELAHSLDRDFFERNRVVVAQVKEFALEAPGRARVEVALRGDSGRPLRYWTTLVERVDVWERFDGTWWLIPGKL